jgi:tetratricopeptide (TPR) repeat protein
MKNNTDLKALISEGKMNLVLDELISFAKNNDSDMLNECLIHKASYTAIMKKINVNTIDRKEGEIEISRINFALLEIIDRLDYQSNKKKTVSFFEKKLSLKIAVLSSIIVLIIAVALFLSTRTNAIKPNPKEAREAFEEGVRLRRNGNIEGSINFASQAILLQTDNAGAYNLRAECYLLKDKLDSAFVDARKSIQIDSTNWLTYSTLAQIEAVRKNDKGFFENIEKALQHHGDIWNYLDEKGIILYAHDEKFIDMLNLYKSLQ